jgi:hypothetical protein
MGSGCIDPHFLDLCTSWRWVVSFTTRQLYPRGKRSRYPLDRRLGEPQSRSRQHGKEKILDPSGTRTPASSVVQPVASSYTDYYSLKVLLIRLEIFNVTRHNNNNNNNNNPVTSVSILHWLLTSSWFIYYISIKIVFRYPVVLMYRCKHSLPSLMQLCS